MGDSTISKLQWNSNGEFAADDAQTVKLPDLIHECSWRKCGLVRVILVFDTEVKREGAKNEVTSHAHLSAI